MTALGFQPQADQRNRSHLLPSWGQTAEVLSTQAAPSKPKPLSASGVTWASRFLKAAPLLQAEKIQEPAFLVT